MCFAKGDLELTAFCDSEFGRDTKCTNCQSDHVPRKLGSLAIAVLDLHRVLHCGVENDVT